MSHRPSRLPTPTTEQAAALVAEVERTLEEGDRVIRELGFDPDKVRAFGRSVPADVQRRAQDLLAADLQAIDDELAQARTRLAAGARTPSSASPRSGHRFV